MMRNDDGSGMTQQQQRSVLHNMPVPVVPELGVEQFWPIPNANVFSGREERQRPIGIGFISEDCDKVGQGRGRFISTFTSRRITPAPPPPPIGIGIRSRTRSRSGSSSYNGDSDSDDSRVEASPAPNPSSEVRYNECEIIIMNGSETNDSYGEFVEGTFSEVGLSIGRMCPNDEVNIHEFLTNLTKKGTKFAIVVRPENEPHHSVTLHILKIRGLSEEHRNVTLTKAFELIKDAKAHLRQKAIFEVPSEVRKTLELVLDDRLITDKEYQASIRYFQDRWEKQLKLEERTEFDPETGIFSEQQLQAKISSILNMDEKGNDTPNIRRVQAAVENLLSSSSVLNALWTQKEAKNSPSVLL